MAKYYVPFVSYASYIVEVEADSEDAAISAAYNEGIPGLCHQCAVIELSDWDLDPNERPWMHE